MPASILDVADLAKVSTATVSRALRGLPNVSPETRRRVIEAAEQLHYVADPSASRLAAGRTSTVGLVVPSISQWYYARLLEAVARRMTVHGMDVAPYEVELDKRHEFLDRLPFRKRVDGLVLVDFYLAPDGLQRLAEAEVPVVTIGTRTGRYGSVLADNVNGARTAVEHLIVLGHTEIGMVGAPRQGPQLWPVQSERRTGYELAHETAGLQVRAEYIMDCAPTMAGGAAVMGELLRRSAPCPTAIFAYCDEVAVGAMTAAQAAGMKVPGDLSIVGFDDHPVAEFFGLTTIDQSVGHQGEAAVEQLIRVFGGSSDFESEVAPARLVVRESTSGRSAAP